MRAMDVKALRAEAMEATTRFFLEQRDFLPSEESEEWEDEYRRQFSLAKERFAAKGPDAAARVVLREERNADWPELSGPPGEARWAMELRDERLKQLQNKEMRAWLAQAWTAARDWIETRDLPAPAFLHRIETQYAGYLRQSAKQASQAQAERQSVAAASAALQRQVQEAGITAAGLVELIDVSGRATAAPLKAKLAELEAGGRNLRIFETANPRILMVIENAEPGRTEYAIERDEGLVADLKLYAQSNRA
jgi:hypothetical protein